MRFFILITAICLGSLPGFGAGSPQATPAAAPPAPTAQTEKSETKSAPAKPAAAESKEVGPNTAVITIKGVCSATASKTAAAKTGATAAAKPSSCVTTITKKELEQVIDAVRPNLQGPQRRMLAQQYADLLVMANAANKAGVEKDPKVQEQIRLQKLQVLANSYTRDLQQKDAEVPQADIEKYYKQNSSKYEQAKLLRIYVPMVITEQGKPPDLAATKALAEKIQQQAAAGEDFDKLQKEAFAAANSKATAPNADMGERRRGTLPQKEDEPVFALQPGQVSAALEETSGFYIYKVVSKDQAPLDKVRDEIKATLGRDRFRESIEKVRNSATTTLNDAYFGSATPPPPLSRSGGMGGAPPTTSEPPEAPKPSPPASPPSK